MEKFTAIMMKVEKPSFEKLAETNAGYIKWLRIRGGTEAVELYYSHLEEILDRSPKDGTTVTMKLVEIGERSVRFYPWTTECPFGPRSDPINVVFTNMGSARNVANKFKVDFVPPWRDTVTWRIPCARAHFALFDNTPHGGSVAWVKMSNSLTNCGCFRRCHIRTFDGGTDSSPNGLGQYSIGSVHYEVWKKPISHIVRRWDGAQQFLDSIFSPGFPLVGSKSAVQIQNPREVLKGIPHDGVATVIELL